MSLIKYEDHIEVRCKEAWTAAHNYAQIVVAGMRIATPYTRFITNPAPGVYVVDKIHDALPIWFIEKGKDSQ